MAVTTGSVLSMRTTQCSLFIMEEKGEEEEEVSYAGRVGYLSCCLGGLRLDCSGVLHRQKKSIEDCNRKLHSRIEGAF